MFIDTIPSGTEKYMWTSLEKKSNLTSTDYYGQLTDTGRSHMTNVGSKLRELYVDKLKFLTPTLDEAESLYLRSTDWSRTLESLHHVLLGLYPPETHRITEPPHIHIKTVNHEDTLYPHINTCSVLKKEFADFRKRVYQDTRQTVDWLKTELNGVAKDVEVDEKKPRWSISPSPHGIYDTVTAAIAHGYYVPPEITPNSLIMAEYLATREWIWSFGQTLTSKRLSIGRLIGELKLNIEGHVRTNANATKMAIFSGHDSTLGPLLLAMDVWDKRWPPFASMITFELFRQKSTAQPTAKSQRQTQPGNYFVRMIYNSEPMYIPGCQSAESHHPGDKSLCTLDAFLKVAEELIPTDYEAECSGSNTSEGPIVS
ncbi:histidine phosphatase superfamily [Paraphysoderma sedebokerense]|nr:histidine phosphatase superfamily [Paraphysoderma sedebokerense]